MKDFLMALFLLLALYGAFDLLWTLRLWRTPHLMRDLAFRLMEAADRREKRMS